MRLPARGTMEHARQGIETRAESLYSLYRARRVGWRGVRGEKRSNVCRQMEAIALYPRAATGCTVEPLCACRRFFVSLGTRYHLGCLIPGTWYPFTPGVRTSTAVWFPLSTAVHSLTAVVTINTLINRLRTAAVERQCQVASTFVRL